jgi:tyrosine-protein phosphatase non-receptor type 1
MLEALAQDFNARDEAKEAFSREDSDVPLGLDRYTSHSATPKETRYINSTGVGHAYVHANWILPEKRYLATQSPLPSTMGDFWLMALKTRCRAIFMLTQFVELGKRRADCYFPMEQYEEERFHLDRTELQIKVKCTRVHRPDIFCTERVFLLALGNEQHTLTHHHCLEWPDGDVPARIQGVKRLLSLCGNATPDHPILVHCSAGLGRAGTFLLARCVLDLGGSGASSREVFSQMLDRIRIEGRWGLVQTAAQYVFAYQLVVAATTLPPPLPVQTIATCLRDGMIQMCAACLTGTARRISRHCDGSRFAYCSVKCQHMHCRQLRLCN